MKKIVIALDKNQNPHIVSYSIKSQDFIHSYLKDSEWINEPIDTTGNVGDGHDIVFDNNNQPHVAYRNKTNKAQKYAVKENGEWKKQPVGPAHVCSIAVDTNNTAHIARTAAPLSSDMPENVEEGNQEIEYIKYLQVPLR